MSAFWDKEEEILVFDKNKKEKIRVAMCETKGKEFVDIRILYDKDGTFTPSSKGVAIPKESFGDIVAAVKAFNSEPKE